MTRVKICGITNIKDALLAAELGADALGFVFAESPRKVSPEKAAEIISELPPYVTTVGVFVNHPANEVREIAAYCKLDVLQFHGDENPAYCRQFHRKVVKALRMRNYTEIEDWIFQENEHEATTPLGPDSTIVAYLVDAYARGQHGGTGIHLNWELVRNLEARRPLILAGGLDPKNVALAIRVVKPYAVDVSSGVEFKPGKKDKYKLREFMKVIKACG